MENKNCGKNKNSVSFVPVEPVLFSPHHNVRHTAGYACYADSNNDEYKNDNPS